MTYYRRRGLAWWEELMAVGAGALAGLATVYLARTWLRRSASGPRRRPAGEATAGPARRRAGGEGEAAVAGGAAVPGEEDAPSAPPTEESRQRLPPRPG